MNNARLYILVRKDLTYSSAGVQAGHATASFCLSSSLAKEWNNRYLIYLEVKNLEELNYWVFKFEKRNIEIFKFHEPDLNNEMTAFAGLVDDDTSGFLSGLNLLE